MVETRAAELVLVRSNFHRLAAGHVAQEIDDVDQVVPQGGGELVAALGELFVEGRRRQRHGAFSRNQTHGFAGDGRVAALETHHHPDAAALGRRQNRPGLVAVGPRRLFDKQVLAGLDAVEGGPQQPLLVHHAIDQVRVDLVEQGAVIAVGVRKAILFRYLREALLVQFAHCGHLHSVGEALDRRVVGALGAASRADESRFKHDPPPSGTKPQKSAHQCAPSR